MAQREGPVVDGAGWADLDPREFARFRRLVSALGRRADAALATLTDRELAHALGVVRLGGAGIGAANAAVDEAVVRDASPVALLPEALLLFGRPAAIRWFVPHHEASMQVLRGDSAEASDFFHWPLFRLAEELLARFRDRNSSQVVRYELVRVAVPAWSEQAFLELLTNALVHRDYTVPGVVHVRWGDGGVEVSNPARPGTGVRPGAALEGLPEAPNPLLVDAFRRAGIAQRTGLGIGRAVAAQLRHGLAAPRFERSTDRTVIAVLPGEPADLAFARYVVARERHGEALGRAELQLVTAMLRGHRLRTAEAAALLTADRSRARSILFGLVRAGLVQVDADGAGRAWSLTDQLRHDLRACAAHVRAQRTGDQPPAVRPAPTGQPSNPATVAEPAGWAIPDAGPAVPRRQRAGGG
ncbi:ATP-binding protein [Frankia sp. AgB32]|uniref:ATP-binding protein n=1 Tax=Frankia sp. AgB32 TaxID=631119 RepID=UPI00200D2B45|nr:ATP-binding protein [Frankia sp. AgB32]